MKKLLGHCFCYPNKLRVCTWIASLLLLGSFIHLYHVNTQWSVEMQRRATLGFPNGGTAPLIALMMSPTFEDFRAIIPESTEKENPDVLNMRRYFNSEYVFLTATAVLLILLSLRHAQDRRGIVATICCLAVLEMILDIWDSRLALAALQDGAKAGAGHWLLPQVNAAKFIVAFITTGALGLLELTDAPHPSLGGYLQSLFGLALVIGMLTGLSSFFFPDAGGLLRQSGLSITLVTVLVLPLWIWQPDRRWTH